MKKLIWGLAVCFIVPLCAGCASTSAPGVVRAQSPPVGADPPPQAVEQHSVPGQSPRHFVEAGVDITANCNRCDDNCHRCPLCSCCPCICGYFHLTPQHALFYHYIPPESTCCLDSCCGCLPSGFGLQAACGENCCAANCNLGPCCCAHREPLVYPQNPTPGAIVQYPYYVCKGPDDFFHPAATSQPNR